MDPVGRFERHPNSNSASLIFGTRHVHQLPELQPYASSTAQGQDTNPSSVLAILTVHWKNAFTFVVPRQRCTALGGIQQLETIRFM